MYGTQTDRLPYLIPPWFENDVKMYGTQTGSNIIPLAGKFENDDEKCMVLKLRTISILQA